MVFQKANKIGNRFKPGQSGNPKGKPKGQTLKGYLSELLRKEIQYKDFDGKPINITAGEALALALTAKGLQTGDYKTIEFITQTVEGLKPPEQKELKDYQKEIAMRAMERLIPDFNKMKDVTK